MDSGAPLGRFLMWCWFAILALTIVFFHLLPLRTSAGGLVSPDWLLGFALAWSVRRPDFVPALLIAAVFLLADLMFLRAPGLMAGLVVLGSEHLKSRMLQLRDETFLIEWGIVAGVIVLITLANKLVLMLFLVPSVPLGPTLLQMLFTVIAYPLVVAVTHYIFKVRKTNPHDGDLAGQRT